MRRPASPEDRAKKRRTSAMAGQSRRTSQVPRKPHSGNNEKVEELEKENSAGREGPNSQMVHFDRSKDELMVPEIQDRRHTLAF